MRQTQQKDAIDAESLPEGSWKIGFSNYFSGNSWKQQMEAEFESEAEKLKEAGIISDYVMLNADNDQSKQISDINDLITMGCDAIVVTRLPARSKFLTMTLVSLQVSGLVNSWKQAQR